jgi:hypothetical protein
LDGGVRFDADSSDGLADSTIEIGLDIAGIFAGDESAVGGFVEDVVGGPEVFADFIGLANDVREEGEVLVLIGDEVEDGDIAWLAVSVNSTIALFDAGGVPWAIEVEQIAGGALQVESFCGGVGGDEDSHGAGRVIEGAFHVTAFHVVHTPEECQDAFGAEAVCESANEVVEGGFVFGEDDESFVIPPCGFCAQVLFDECIESSEA